MNNKLVVGNFKMNMSFSDVGIYINKIKGNINSKNVVLCPTSIHVPYFLNLDFEVGLQDTFYENKGSFTGQISPMQAKEVGINYTIIGHSEIRKYDNELESIINKKVQNATNTDLITILCIGESLEEKSMMKTELVLRRQIYSALVGADKMENLVIAYEPVWAIGNNVTPTKEEIDKTATYIKSIVKQSTGYDGIRVLYGGSVNSSNIEMISSIGSIDGVLVGGASLDPDEFIKIKEVVLK